MTAGSPRGDASPATDESTSSDATPDVRPASLVEPTAEQPPGEHESTDGEAAASVFPQSVASGGPTPTGVVLWTRLDPERYVTGEPVRVVVARDEAFTDTVVDGYLPDEHLADAADLTVRVDVDGALEPDSSYWYRFHHDGVTSRPGRCRTLPAPGSSPESVRSAVLACQDYENGYYGALAHVADEDVDFLLHLGDFIYESTADLFKGRGSARLPDRNPSVPSGNDLASTLADFRALHRTYRSDELLQRALESHTLILGWDDHGVANDRYWDDERDAPVLPDHPDGDDPTVATRITEAGIQAWYEYLPARVRYEPTEPHIHDAFRLYRSLRFGDLLQLVVTDHRLYRDGPPPRALSVFGVTLGLGNDDDSDRSMLGAEQREWFERQTRAADTRWFGWASAVLTIPFRIGVGPLAVYPKASSTWDGFGAERRRVFELLGDSEPAVVTLSGDLHSYVVGTQRLDGTRGEAVGTEFMTPAVTSVNIAESLGIESGVLARLTRPLVRRAVPAMNPQMEFFDTHEWGYSVVEFTRDACTYTAYAVDKTVDSAEADRTVVSRYRRRHDRAVPTAI